MVHFTIKHYCYYNMEEITIYVASLATHRVSIHMRNLTFLALNSDRSGLTIHTSCAVTKQLVCTKKIPRYAKLAHAAVK